MMMMNNSNNKQFKIEMKQKYYFFYFVFFLSLLLNKNLVESIILNHLRQLKVFNSEIHLVIHTPDDTVTFIDTFNPEPFEILINGVKKREINSEAYFTEGKNDLIIKFDKKYESCNMMFESTCFYNNVTEIDLSKFDASNCLTMKKLFYPCSDLIKINFGNINTSSVENMNLLFRDCKNLISIDLSKFDTSKVTSMSNMFYGCSKLKYLDLSNFQTLKINTIEYMFYDCESLIYLNIYSFKLNSTVRRIGAFTNINSNAKYCIKDEETKNFLLGKYVVSVCSDTCLDENNKKIDFSTKTCIESCSKDKYKLNNACYNECPNNTYIKFYEDDEYSDNKNKCFENPIKGYYVDTISKSFKKCFKNCKFCYGEGNETINNCKECITNLVLLNESKYSTNCYEKCDYYYYFDELDVYHCVSRCPNKLNQTIKEKKKCIDYCKNDNIYIYEFNNNCYSICPSGTYILEDKTDYYKK